MIKKKKSWGLNILIILVLIIVSIAFTAHYKNWTKITPDNIQILSGIYYKQIQFSDLDSVKMVDKIPSMERINGFSAMRKEKGVYKDSLTGHKVYVYVDNLSSSKIKIVYQDSLKLFLNFTDSIQTQEMHQFLLTHIMH